MMIEDVEEEETPKGKVKKLELLLEQGKWPKAQDKDTRYIQRVSAKKPEVSKLYWCLIELAVTLLLCVDRLNWSWDEPDQQDNAAEEVALEKEL